MYDSENKVNNNEGGKILVFANKNLKEKREKKPFKTIEREKKTFGFK